MYQLRVFIKLRESIIDPAGTAVQNALQHLGFHEVNHVRIEKVVSMTVNSVENIEARVEEMCKQLLVNAVMEDYRIEIEAV